MSKPAVHVFIAAWPEHKKQLQQIRETVFINEQKVPREIEWDGEDEGSQHFLAVNEQGEYLGCARLLPTGQIGRMAVLKQARSKGIGALLLQASVDAAIEGGFQRVHLHAQSYAEEFYRKGGFSRYGDEFMEAGIAHVSMEMMLPLAFHAPDLSEIDRSKTHATKLAPHQELHLQRAAETHVEPQKFSDTDSAVNALHKICAQTRRKLFVFHPTLEQDIFEAANVVHAISEFVRSGRECQVKILVLQSKLIIDRGHDLLDLARRLDQKMEIRVLPEKPSSATSAFVCADQQSYWMLPNWETPEGIVDLNNPVTTDKLMQTFDLAWGRSVHDPQFRRLSL